jgi:hypothetical protein
VAVALASAGLAGPAVIAAPAPAASAIAARGRSSSVVVGIASRPGPVVPPSFLGLATEYLSIPVYERRARLFDRVLSLLAPTDGSPLILRIGGLSADDSLWAPAIGSALPAKATALTPGSLDQIAALVRTEHLRVILDLNLAADVPGGEAEMAAAAIHDLPRDSIAALEIGNEPDYYRYALRGNPAYYPQTFSPALYAQRFADYADALRARGDAVPLAGPALANPVADYSYLSRLVSADRPELGMLTVHRYALSACARTDSPLYPTITRLLRPAASVGLADSLARSVALARAEHLPIRWDELNSVTCGGTLGVSDSFASALWGTDTLFAALATGVTGVNVQMRPTALNAPFYLTAAGVQPRPLLYGMLLFARALGADARPVATTVSEPSGAGVSGWAVRVGRRRLNIVLLNTGSGRETVTLALADRGPASVQRLLAASILTESRVTLAGQQIDGAGRWRGRFRVSRVSWSHRGYRVTMPAFSGALVGLGR